MAGFNFKKLTRDKNKSSKNKGTGGNASKESSNAVKSASSFMHFNLGHHDNSDEDLNSSPQQSQGSSSASRQASYGPDTTFSSGQQRQRQYISAQPRIYPTPVPADQRSVSGATQLMQFQQQEREQQAREHQERQQQQERQRQLESEHRLREQQLQSVQHEQQLPNVQQEQTIRTPVPPEPNVFSPSPELVPKGNVVWNRIKLKDSPFPRYRHVTSSYATEDDRVFVIGGLHDQSVFGDVWIIKSLENGTKFTSTTIDITENTPPPRVGHAATLCGNAFVVFGGDTHKVNKDGLMDDDLYLFNINSYKWTIPNPIGPRPLGRYGHKVSIIATTPMKTKLYLFGGQFDDTYFNNLAVFDLSQFRRPDSHWEFLKPKSFMPPPLTNHTMVSYQNKLWIFGGDTLQGLINKIFMYDPEVNDWTVVETFPANNDQENFPPPMQEHASVMYGDLMVVMGGKDEQDNYLNTVYFLKINTLEWYKLPFLSVGIPQGRSGHSITLLKGNKLLIMGGDKFDYARPEEHGLHTTDTDMGSGTILYTLDLSNLEQLCPGISDKTVEGLLENPYPNSGFTPNDTSITQNSDNATVPPSKEEVHTVPEISAHNILTPYGQKIAETTPTLPNTDGTFNKLVAPVEESKLDSIQEKDVPVNTATLGPFPTVMAAQNLPATPVQETYMTPEVTRTDSIRTPNVAAASNIESKKEVSTPLHGGTGEHADHPEVEVGIPTIEVVNSSVQAKSTPSSVPPEKETDEQKRAVTEEVTDVLPETHSTMGSTGSINDKDQTPSVANPSHVSGVLPGIVNDETEERGKLEATSLSKESTPVVHEQTDSTKVLVGKEVLKSLRDELLDLKQMANDKAVEASDRIRTLELENKKVTALRNQGVQLERENEKLRKVIDDLQDRSNEKILTFEILNTIIRQQNQTIDKMMVYEKSAEKYNELKGKYNRMKESLSQAESKLKGYDTEFTSSVKQYSNDIEHYLRQWKEKTGEQPTDLSSGGITDDGSVTTFTSSSPRHHTKVTKLSNHLDELVLKAQDLRQSRGRLDAEYKELEMRQRSLSQDMLSNSQGEDEDGDNESAARKLELAQQELERYKQMDKNLEGSNGGEGTGLL
ncbi:Kel2p KNAG_0K00560 [Huiozyma naganishii CBS 8797]|uniref:Uncharacterized protein n=1 Tax=Huiozyma naganishii (strain ATCC MYA-139 / BCRC 22969 / CBS 8797 / KCTC 17520 / NBRC 10181 / NCYC 3082 / Yp74L-3) TaxID=1071383 RepID=J7SA16_HUIN7|nr:hypothetical protein KNAG_0K00560 [Kazachstania naganishii CBS 8797]CCK72424.1 hypothetical protein KNAG_0K00560 [Kazachstania naganishii CBS 8797]